MCLESTLKMNLLFFFLLSVNVLKATSVKKNKNKNKQTQTLSGNLKMCLCCWGRISKNLCVSGAFHVDRRI